MSASSATGLAAPARDLTGAPADPTPVGPPVPAIDAPIPSVESHHTRTGDEVARANGEVSLAGLAPGTTGVIVAVVGAGPESLRLRDLGFVAGTRIRSIKRAPLGDPVVYELRGTRLCLRRSESDRVRVRRD